MWGSLGPAAGGQALCWAWWAVGPRGGRGGEETRVGARTTHGCHRATRERRDRALLRVPPEQLRVWEAVQTRGAQDSGRPEALGRWPSSRQPPTAHLRTFQVSPVRGCGDRGEDPVVVGRGPAALLRTVSSAGVGRGSKKASVPLLNPATQHCDAQGDTRLSGW